jgi:hypothetical protein
MNNQELASTFAMLTIQFSAMNQILMGLLMVLDPAVLQSIQETIQTRYDTLEAESVDHHATAFALAQLELALNGPAPKKRFQVVTGKKD